MHIAGDGVYSYDEIDGSITLSDVGKNSTRTLVKGDAVTDVRHSNSTLSSIADIYIQGDGNRLAWQSFHVSADLKHILFAKDRKQVS